MFLEIEIYLGNFSTAEDFVDCIVYTNPASHIEVHIKVGTRRSGRQRNFLKGFFSPYTMRFKKIYSEKYFCRITRFTSNCNKS